ncbi:hypothetical protein QBC33DRAFT_620855 [Phialemonium atrogriseum]|uniref:Methyltransferase n=1 Tax=Phialemonium atrogriseum TaxID=1093897 RepID=A0AAJ0FKT5_9PEZI|nr:uncharacterized protein QBC33DRAFT_620855 [Phialemonium atrogriseum]KAK1765944.1 hypothetical protein QBC33DRAFT_620855 [Phialemonium atrogriseum]
MTTMAGASDIYTSIRFLKNDELYHVVKTYNLEFRSEEIPISNALPEKVDNLLVKDIRGHEQDFTFDLNGFAVLDMQTSLSYDDFKDSSKIEHVYCQEVASCLLKYTQAAAVQIFDVQIRRRHPDFPFPDTNLEINNQPAVQAHIDASPEAVRLLIRSLNTPEEANCRAQGRFIYLNVWKPLKGPVREWPLALCDASSVDPSDLRAHDTVFDPTTSRENLMVHFNANQRWYYLSEQLPSELWVFRQCDSAGKQGVPHVSFELPTQANGPDDPRESVEVRALLYFE